MKILEVSGDSNTGYICIYTDKISGFFFSAPLISHKGILLSETTKYLYSCNKEIPILLFSLCLFIHLNWFIGQHYTK